MRPACVAVHCETDDWLGCNIFCWSALQGPGIACREAPLSATRALASANRMAYGKGPWKSHMGHLLHMPSHTYVR